MPTTQLETSIVYRAFSGRVYKSAPSSGPVPAILTYPLRDYAGDEIRPGGGTWSNPLANWIHEIPVGRGDVCLKALTLNGQTSPVDYGETTFFSKAADLQGADLTRRERRTYKPIGTYSQKAVLTAAEQVERLVRDDVATGVSVEFKAAGPKGEAWWELDDYSELEGRPCRHYEDWIGLAYAHAIQPINPGARTLLTDNIEHMQKAIRIAQTGSFAGKPLCEVVYKAFMPLKSLAKPNNRISVHVENKAMDDELGEIPPVGGTVAMDEEQTDGPTPAVKTCLEGAQMLMDLSDRLTQSIGMSEHKKARKYVAKIIAELMATADEMAAMGESVRAELDSDLDQEGKADKTAAEGDEPSEYGADDEIEEKALVVAPLERDEEGFIVCKSFPNWKPQRFHFSDLKPIEEHAEDLEAEFKAAMDELNREQRKARPILRAKRANAR